MDLMTSQTLKATCRVLGIVNAIFLGLMLFWAAIVTRGNWFAGLQVAVFAIILFLAALFFIRCGECLAEIHNHFCRLEGLDREWR